MGVQVRGISSTAITKILLDEGIPVSSPSSIILQRFGDVFSPEPPTSFLRASGDRIFIEGNSEELEIIVNALKRNLKYSCYIKKWISPPVFKGIVRKKMDAGYEIDLGKEGNAVLFSTKEELKEGEEILGTVLGKEKRIFRPNPYISGRYITINLTNPEIKVSKHIANKETINKLIAMLDLKDFGVYFKKSSENAKLSDLMNELTKLVEIAEKTIEKAKEINAGKLFSGFYSYEVVLSLPDFEKLDKIRATVVHTIKMHHLLKSLGKDASFLVDVLEYSETDPRIGEKVYQGYLKYTRSHGSDLKGIIHRKISGEHVILRGYTRKTSSEEITFVRIMKGSGVYDGLGVKKEAGDYAVTHIFPGKWWLYHSYYDSQGKYKGSYFNVNTPPEILPEFVRYTDLEVDVILWPNGETKVIDQDLLEDAMKEGQITEEMKNMAMKAVEEIKDFIKKNKEKIVKDEQSRSTDGFSNPYAFH